MFSTNMSLSNAKNMKNIVIYSYICMYIVYLYYTMYSTKDLAYISKSFNWYS